MKEQKIRESMTDKSEKCGCKHNFTPGMSIPITGWVNGEPICAKCKKPLRSPYPYPRELAEMTAKSKKIREIE